MSEISIAILDDYQAVALDMADWSALEGHARISVFTDHLADEAALIERLKPFDILCIMRERTPLPRAIIEHLPRLKMIASTGRRNASIDAAAASERGIEVMFTGYDSSPTIELTWGLILAASRNLVEEANSVRAGGWQLNVGEGLRGKTLGILGLGNIGSEMARIGGAFGMDIIAWSQNLTEEKAAAAGARLTTKEGLFQQADIVTIHLVLSERTRGLVGAQEFALMKPTARLINTSRGPIVQQTALIEALQAGRIAGAAIDVYDVEPLPPEHPFRSLQNVLATPHMGYVSREAYKTFYGDTVKNIKDWLERRQASLK